MQADRQTDRQTEPQTYRHEDRITSWRGGGEVTILSTNVAEMTNFGANVLIIN